jgi:hypothetical protein
LHFTLHFTLHNQHGRHAKDAVFKDVEISLNLEIVATNRVQFLFPLLLIAGTVRPIEWRTDENMAQWRIKL